MTAAAIGTWVGEGTAVAAFLTGVLGILRYFNYRTRRDRITAVGSALDAAVAALASENEVQRAAAAIRMRRFFDRRSELGVAGAAYANDAQNVIAASLRDLPTGNLQKLLADGLAYAPSLAGADLQRTNLQSAYLAGVDMAGADLFQADLSDGSLKGADARGVTFYRTRLVRTVFVDADLRDARFFDADLREATFSGARLAGARFAHCRHLPTALAAALDAEGCFRDPVPFPPPPAEARRSPTFFISRPFRLSAEQHSVLRLISDALAALGADVSVLQATDSSPAGVLADVRQAMSGCDGVVILGFSQLEVSAGRYPGRPAAEGDAGGLALATPWNHAEAGLAAGLGLPIFRIHDGRVSGGVFTPRADTEPPVDLTTRGIDATLRAVSRWARNVIGG
jgi:uncharacterized protein YjbI with pentapeptide repeats